MQLQTDTRQNCRSQGIITSLALRASSRVCEALQSVHLFLPPSEGALVWPLDVDGCRFCHASWDVRTMSKAIWYTLYKFCNLFSFAPTSAQETYSSAMRACGLAGPRDWHEAVGKALSHANAIWCKGCWATALLLWEQLWHSPLVVAR